MFRLARVKASHARPSVANVLPRPPPAFSIPPAVATGIRTYKLPPTGNRKARPDPRIANDKKDEQLAQKPRTLTLPKRSAALFRMLYRKHEISDTNPEETYKIYEAYLDALSRRREDKSWESRFLSKTRANGVDLHDMALLIMDFPNKRSEEDFLFFHVLNTAAGIGYDASALTLGRILVPFEVSVNDPYSYWAPQWEHMRKHVNHLIRLGRDANAIVLEGLLHLAKRTAQHNRAALTSFQQARVLGAETTHFDWEAGCLMGIAEASKRLNLQQDAIDMYRLLESKGYPIGVYEMAMANPTGPDYLRRLTTAAISGWTAAYEPLVNEHLRLSRESREQGKRKLADEHQFWAVEYGNILKYRRQHRI